MEFFVNDLTFMESIIDNRLMKLNYQFERAMMVHKENLHAIETKVLMERGTDDDLVLLYTAEAEETKAKTGGILSSIITAIKNFFRKLRETLFGKKIDENDLPDEVEVPEDPKTILDYGNKLMGEITGFISGHKKEIAIGVAAAGATAGAVVITKKKILPYTRDLEKYLANQEKVLADASNPEVLAKLNPEQQQILKSALDKVKANGSKVSKIMTAVNTKAGREGEEGDYDEIRHYKKNMDDARQREDKKKREAKEAEKAARANMSKDDKIIIQTGKTKEAIEAKLKELRKQDSADKSFIASQTSKLKNANSVIGDKGGIRGAVNKLFGKGKGDDESKILAANKIKADLEEAKKRQAERQAKIKTLEQKLARTIEHRNNATAGRNTNESAEENLEILNSILGELTVIEYTYAVPEYPDDDIITESGDELVNTANAEIDYFINSLL